MTLAEALESVDLEPGRTYRCQVRGKAVEVRVGSAAEHGGAAPSTKRLLTKGLCEEDIMLDAWCELPGPKPEFRVVVRPGGPLRPDRIEFPPEGDKPA